MYVKDLSSVPKRELEGGDAPGGEMSITWVDVEPGAQQPAHSHGPQQVYVITRGSGRMKVGDDERVVTVGHMVFIPPDTEHGIVNTGDETLTYVSAATPAFPVTELYDAGQISLSP